MAVSRVVALGGDIGKPGINIAFRQSCSSRADLRDLLLGMRTRIAGIRR
jgi:hypothetical protein